MLLAAAAPAWAGYHVTTIDGPASPSLLGTVVDGINNHGLASVHSSTISGWNRARVWKSAGAENGVIEHGFRAAERMPRVPTGA